MLKTIFFFLLSTQLFCGQIIRDTILGNPKFVKETVVFLTEIESYKFLSTDGDYGHATIMTPENLRKSMRDSWFGSAFCRYINNETYFDKNRNISNEKWFYKSGKLVGDYRYSYDRFNRLVFKSDSSDYATIKSKMFYQSCDSNPIFKETIRYKKDGTLQKRGGFLDTFPEKQISEYDVVNKVENVYLVTNKKNKIVSDEGAYQEIRDSIFNRYLIMQRYYNDRWQISKSVKFYTDYKNATRKSKEFYTYEYDELNRKIKESKYENDRLITSSLYTYNPQDYLIARKTFVNDRLLYSEKYSYENNYIVKLEIKDNFGNESNQDLNKIVTFKYKFDKQKNWTEITKIVDDKNLYVWKREIEYY
ncbi:hypothetical protein Q73A0000_07475 [Kaistella flava (ex Peng et al. 2021)]|uniref:YD repeat-containing protein n=1 Tax=Kaistella flava (ex Peng et al. 2021) TaxID=2038776 RepID=A0A7M2Y967_9FLAO|nr:hypothetical protein [Kaistella flava (ex Peng et al. 2021)]QOW10214.1 hypothetical protein Q73A0000_07475 [Kaistella flava (ex Peng et al. 2021)]